MMWKSLGVSTGFFVLYMCIVYPSYGMTVANTTGYSCNQTYNHSSGVLHYHNASSDAVDANIVCWWIFTFNTSEKNSEVLLVLSEFHLDFRDSLTFEGNGNVTGPLNVGPFSGVMGPFMVLTGSPNIKVTLKTSDSTFPRRFEIRYFLQPTCAYNVTSVEIGTLLSPFYDKNRTEPIACSVKVTVKSKERFKLVTMLEAIDVNDKLQLDVKNTDSQDGHYTGTNIPMEFTSDDELEAQLSIQPNGTVQQLRFSYQQAVKECTDTIELKDSDRRSWTVSNPKSFLASVSDTPSVKCRTIVFTKENVAGLSVKVIAHNMTGALDQLLVLNGTERTSYPLLHLTSSNQGKWKDPYVVTSAKKVSVSIESAFPTPELNASVTIELSQYGGFFEGSGQIGVSNQKDGVPAVFLLKVDSTKQVKLDLIEKSLPKKGTVEFYNSFERTAAPFARLSDFPEGSVISPSSIMMVIARGFNSETFSASFGSMEKGCFSMADPTENFGSYSLYGECLPICAWTIPAKTPNVSDNGVVEQHKLHFSSFFLNHNDTLRIVENGKTIVVNVAGPLSQINDLLFDCNDTVNVIVQRDCNKTGTAVVADYSPLPVCERNETLTPGQSILIASPDYPNSYPLGGQCRWVLTTSKDSLLHVQFNTLRLGSTSHELLLYKFVNSDERLVDKFTGANVSLPHDYLLNGNLTIILRTNFSNVGSNHVASGFEINVTAADCGGEMITNDSGSFQTPLGKKVNTTDARLCVWLVGVNSTSKAPRIMQYNSSANGSVKGYLEIYEGDSVRDSLSLNLTGTNILTRLNRLMVVYNNVNSSVAAGPWVSFNYAAHECNTSMMCLNGICMHDTWFCDGKNDCGDWSDERDCKGLAPVPPEPTPSPQPEPSTHDAGVSTTALALGILAALLIGSLLGFAAPAAYRRIRSGQFGSSYSSFSNTADA